MCADKSAQLGLTETSTPPPIGVSEVVLTAGFAATRPVTDDDAIDSVQHRHRTVASSLHPPMITTLRQALSIQLLAQDASTALPWPRRSEQQQMSRHPSVRPSPGVPPTSTWVQDWPIRCVTLSLGLLIWHPAGLFGMVVGLALQHSQCGDSLQHRIPALHILLDNDNWILVPDLATIDMICNQIMEQNEISRRKPLVYPTAVFYNEFFNISQDDAFSYHQTYPALINNTVEIVVAPFFQKSLETPIEVIERKTCSTSAYGIDLALQSMTKLFKLSISNDVENALNQVGPYVLGWSNWVIDSCSLPSIFQIILDSPDITALIIPTNATKSSLPHRNTKIPEMTTA
ncbi:hypothetical protein M422DRAFT_239095 [Sphaerobolus stellatus SS14]|nr:hypothetical protein M422DRAFT_239095 [Sphaerobolus stellatus SS14]